MEFETASARPDPSEHDREENFMSEIRKRSGRTLMSNFRAGLAALAVSLWLWAPAARASSDSSSDSSPGRPRRALPEAPTSDPYYGYGIDDDKNIKGQELDSSFTIGEDLAGFDISLLRSSKRVEKLRYEVRSLQATLRREFGDHSQIFVVFSCALEFGSKSGVAETRQNEKAIRVLIQELTSKFPVTDLKQVVGKIELKNAIAKAVNGSLTTARVRKVYLTDFRIMVGNE